FLPGFGINPSDTQVSDEPLPSGDADQDQVFTRRKKKTEQTQHLRTTVPGQVTGSTSVTSDAGDTTTTTHQVTRYPNSTANAGKPVSGVKLLGGGKAATDSWALVFWHIELKITTTQILESGPGITGEKVVSTSTEIKKVAEHWEMAPGGAGGGLLGKVTAG